MGPNYEFHVTVLNAKTCYKTSQGVESPLQHVITIRLIASKFLLTPTVKNINPDCHTVKNKCLKININLHEVSCIYKL